MKKNQIKKSALIAFGILVVAAVTVISCQKKGADHGGDRSTLAGIQAGCDTMSVPVTASGVITIDTLTSDKVWLINGVSYVDTLQTLVIEPGTRVVSGALKTYNDPLFGTQNLKGVLVVAMGGKLIADGLLPNGSIDPIVFTTREQACGLGCSAPGTGASVVLLGRSITNQTTPPRIEGIPQPAGTNITYGGSVSNDNSGILRYVRIEFPGFRLTANNEVNGLTCGAVGSGTTLSHIQVSYSNDDAFEFFGGTVNADHLVAIGNDDDDYDFDFGYTGTIDYAIGLKDPCTTHSTSSGSSDANGIESDNQGTTTSTNTPFTKPTLRHFTLLGYASNSADLFNGNRWRRSTSLDIQYSIVGGFPTGVRFQDITSGTANFSNNVVHGYSVDFTTPSGSVPGTMAGNSSSTAASASGFLLLAGGDDAFFTCSGAANYSVEFLQPVAGSPAIDVNNAALYRGAIDPAASSFWTDGWVVWDLDVCNCCGA